MILLLAILSTSPTFAKRAASIVIDVATCAKADPVRTYGPLGSTTYQVQGKKDALCLLDWGEEIEDPRWNGSLDHHCQVPVALGTVRLARIGRTGLDMAPLEKYCASPAAGRSR